MFVERAVEALDEPRDRVPLGADNLIERQAGHPLECGRVAQALDDLAEVREVLLQRDVVPLGLEDARVLAGEQHQRSPQRDRLEDPRRDHVHHHIALERRQHVAVDVVVGRGGVLLLVRADAALDRAVEVGDRRAALRAQRRPAGAHESVQL